MPQSVNPSDKNRRPYAISLDWLSVCCTTTLAFFQKNNIKANTAKMDEAKERLREDTQKIYTPLSHQERAKLKEEIRKDWNEYATGEAEMPEIIQPTGYYIRECGTGTKQWARIAQVYEPNHTLVGTLTWQPRSTAIKSDLAILKLENAILYEADCWERAVAAIVGLGLKFHSISRLDVACDFNEFYGGLTPRNFLDRVSDGTYVKVGLTRAFASMDFGYKVVKKHDDSPGVVANPMSEAEEQFAKNVKGWRKKTTLLPALPFTQQEYVNAIWHFLENAIKGDREYNERLCAALANTIKRVEVLEFTRRCYVIAVNKDLEGTGLPLLEYHPTLFAAKPIKPRVDSLTFGRAGKAIQAIIYNKTRELQEVKMKQYIVDTWQRAGLDVSRDVWRVEIRIQGAGKEFQCLENQELGQLSFVDIALQEQIEHIFSAYAEKYFKFYHWDDKHVKVQNMRRLQLFCFVNAPLIRPKRIKKQCNPTRFTKVIVGQLTKAIGDASDVNSKYYQYILRRARDFYSNMYQLGTYIEELDAKERIANTNFIKIDSPADHNLRLYAGSTDNHRLAAAQANEFWLQKQKSIWARLNEQYEKAKALFTDNGRYVNNSEPIEYYRLDYDYNRCVDAIFTPMCNIRVDCPF